MSSSSGGGDDAIDPRMMMPLPVFHSIMPLPEAPDPLMQKQQDVITAMLSYMQGLSSTSDKLRATQSVSAMFGNRGGWEWFITTIMPILKHAADTQDQQLMQEVLQKNVLSQP